MSKSPFSSLFVVAIEDRKTRRILDIVGPFESLQAAEGFANAPERRPEDFTWFTKLASPENYRG